MEAKKRNKAVPAVYLVLKITPPENPQNEFLFMRRAGSGYYDNWYCLPAGHIEEGELPIDALIRETKEELGIILEKDNLRLAHTMYRTSSDETGDRVDLFFEARKWSGHITIMEPEKCACVRWIALRDLPKNTMHHVRYALEKIEKRIRYSELGIKGIHLNPTLER